MPVVHRNTPRTDLDVIEELAKFGVATLHEAQGRTGLFAPRLRPIHRPASIAGNALTCEVTPGDNWSIHIALDVARPGDVLIVTPTNDSDDGYFGELLATSAMAHGVRGLIIDAGVRDVRELTVMGFPVWSKLICAQGTVKQTPGDIQIPITCAGVAVRPGDVVVADDDGALVVPRERVAEVLDAARQRDAKERVTRERLSAGELTLDIYAMRERLTDSGLRYVDDST